MQVSKWMTREPYCVLPDERLDVVAEAMRAGGFRRAPVVDTERRLLGIVTDRDLREHKGFLAASKVSAAMVEPALAVAPDDPIEDAARLMLERKIGGLPVIDSQRHVVGVVTETDLLRGFLDGAAPGERGVRIDFTFASGQRGFGPVVHAVEQAGGTVLGFGTFQPAAAGDSERRYFVRITGPTLEPMVEALRAAGCSVSAIHDLRSAEAR